MSKTVDYYKVLQLAFGAGKEEIVSSYRRLCKLYHPDVNGDPAAENTMKDINLAYHILGDEQRREEYNSTLRANKFRRNNFVRADTGKAEGGGEEELARASINSYFADLTAGRYEEAYRSLSKYDRQYVTLDSFLKWRMSINRLFKIRSFSVYPDSGFSRISLEDGSAFPSKNFFVQVEEKNLETQTSETYRFIKSAVFESGFWRVFLGYRDLNEIARTFESLAREREKEEMTKLWEAYCKENCRELGMLTLEGFIKAASKELYRHERYGQNMCVAVFSLRVTGNMEKAVPDEALAVAAEVLTKNLRAVDIPAYIGGGDFAVLYIELKHKYLMSITERLAESMRRGLAKAGHRDITCAVGHMPYSGGGLAAYVDRLRMQKTI